MAVAKGVGRIVGIGLAVIAVVILIAIFVGMSGGEAPAKQIILDSIELRSADSPVKKAQMISALDSLVYESDNSAVDEQWVQVTACLNTGCPDDAFFDMVFITTNEFAAELPKSELIVDILIVNRYWDSEEQVVEFSKSLSDVDTAMQELDSRKAKKAWDDIVECNNVCPERNDYYFELISSIVQNT